MKYNPLWYTWEGFPVGGTTIGWSTTTFKGERKEVVLISYKNQMGFYTRSFFYPEQDSKKLIYVAEGPPNNWPFPSPGPPINYFS